MRWFTSYFRPLMATSSGSKILRSLVFKKLWSMWWYKFWTNLKTMSRRTRKRLKKAALSRRWCFCSNPWRSAWIFWGPWTSYFLKGTGSESRAICTSWGTCSLSINLRLARCLILSWNPITTWVFLSTQTTRKMEGSIFRIFTSSTWRSRIRSTRMSKTL